MFLRTKRAKGHRYLLLVENSWENGTHRQRTIHNFGRHDLVDPRAVDQVLASMPGFAFLREKLKRP